MALYEYRCRECDTRFEVRRSMTDTGEVVCPDGHANTVKLLSSFASVMAGAASGSGAPMPAARPAGGCGAACGCGH
jgi:putative FmdB family regulatory protein